MDEVSSHVRLQPAVSLTARSTQRLFHLVFESHTGRALVPSPKRSASPRATSTHCNVDSLKVLDPERPIREADIGYHAEPPWNPISQIAVSCLNCDPYDQ